MKKILFLSFIAFLVFFSNSSQATPAYPNLITVTQPDGTTISFKIYGDEFFNYKLTVDGYQIVQLRDGFYYYYTPLVYEVSVNELMRASEPLKRTNAENKYVENMSIGVDQTYLEVGKEAARVKRDFRDAINTKMQEGEKPNLAQKGLVILAQYQDVKFLESTTKATFENLLNQDGYNLNGAIGSAKNYFEDNSLGTYSPTFVVTDIITLPQDRAYYGRRTADASDVKAPQMALDACNAVREQIDFSQFDANEDGKVDDIFIFFAGHNESEGGPEESIWPHRWEITVWNTDGSDRTFNGKTISGYACTSELRGSGGERIAGVGTFCHEFGHVLGLPDFYDTDYSVNGVGPDLYDISIMSKGGFNEDGDIPPYYTGLERNIVGWNSFKDLMTAPSPLSIYPIHTQKGNDVWRIQTEMDGEFFYVECRKPEKWDAPLKSGGLLVYHIDRTEPYKDRWGAYNTVNAYAEHPCAKFVESSGNYNENYKISDVAYPGAARNKSFYISDYGFSSWGGEILSYGVTDIEYNDGVVTLTPRSVSELSVMVSQREADVYFVSSGLDWTLKYKSSEESDWNIVENIKDRKYKLLGLSPDTRYLIEAVDNNNEQSSQTEFTTLPNTDIYPSLEGVEGICKLNTIIKLNVINIQKDYTSITWENSKFKVSDNTIIASQTGEFTITCTIEYKDGLREVISRVIMVER